ncbi:MAG: hypothetical protein JOZ32_20165 [Bryobacterales bacterium]|nr:hypothetical protein [Bryobacterales bacterium]
MPTYRVTFLFSGGGEGWSETHLFNSTTTDFNALRPLIGQVAQLRAQLLGDPFYVWGVRVAQYLKNDGTRATRAVRLWKGDPAGAWAGWYNVNFGKAGWGSEPSEVAVQAIGFTGPPAPAQFQGNQNFTSLGGVPDDVIEDNGTVLPEAKNFGGLFDQWAGALYKANSGWGWGAANVLVDCQITTIIQNANGTVSFTTPTVIPGGITTNVKYPCRFRDINNGRSALNGEAIVYFVSTLAGVSTFTTREVIGIPTSQTGGFCKVYSPVPTFVPYIEIDLGLIAIKHKRGKSPAARRGRAPRRIRG